MQAVPPATVVPGGPVRPETPSRRMAETAETVAQRGRLRVSAAPVVLLGPEPEQPVWPAHQASMELRVLAVAAVMGEPVLMPPPGTAAMAVTVVMAVRRLPGMAASEEQAVTVEPGVPD